jgi:ATP-dependent Clp protease ATP-binding subunit ClpA
LEKVFEKYYKEYKKLWKDKRWIQIPRLKKEEIKKVVEEVKKEWSGVRWIEKYIYNELENKVIKKILKSKKLAK